MSEKPKTHRERAEEAREQLLVGRERWSADQQVEVVAATTYPTELARAAKRAMSCAHKGEGLCSPCYQALRYALALYEPEAENA